MCKILLAKSVGIAGVAVTIAWPYRRINNSTIESYGGAITAALFLKEFVSGYIPWLRFDLMAWNFKKTRRPQGGEARVLRALFCYLMERVIDYCLLVGGVITAFDTVLLLEFELSSVVYSGAGADGVGGT